MGSATKNREAFEIRPGFLSLPDYLPSKMKRPCAWMEDYAPHRKTHVAERDFVLRMAEDKANNLNPLFVPALTVEDVFRNTMAKLFSRRTENKKENGGEREASCVSCVVSKKCSGKCGVCDGSACDSCLTSCPECAGEVRVCGNCSIDGVCLNCNSMQ